MEVMKSSILLPTAEEDHDEDPDLKGIKCARYPTMRVCGCTIPCRVHLKRVQPQKIIEGLFIGPLVMAYKKTQLSTIGVKYVIDLSDQPYTKYTDLFKYLSIGIQDNSYSSISDHFATTNLFIDEGISKGGVLIHCEAGISRSATIAIAYLMYKLNLSLEEAFSLVRAARNQIQPNEGFMAQLREYEDSLRIAKMTQV